MLEIDLQKVDWNTSISKLPKNHDVINIEKKSVTI